MPQYHVAITAERLNVDDLAVEGINVTETTVLPPASCTFSTSRPLLCTIRISLISATSNTWLEPGVYQFTWEMYETLSTDLHTPLVDSLDTPMNHTYSSIHLADYSTPAIVPSYHLCRRAACLWTSPPSTGHFETWLEPCLSERDRIIESIGQFVHTIAHEAHLVVLHARSLSITQSEIHPLGTARQHLPYLFLEILILNFGDELHTTITAIFHGEDDAAIFAEPCTLHARTIPHALSPYATPSTGPQTHSHWTAATSTASHNRRRSYQSPSL